MAQNHRGLERADIEEMAGFWGMNPAAIGQCLLEHEHRIRNTALAQWPLLWGELLARATDGLRDGLARKLLGMLDVRKASAETVARMAMDWRVEPGGQHWALHRELAWDWLTPWMKSARQELVPEVARLVGGGTLHVAMRHTGGPLPKILTTVGPRRWVMGNDDIMVPWIHAWAQEAILSASTILAEHALDLLMAGGCALDAQDREGRRAIELIEPDYTILKVTHLGVTHRINHASALIGMLLERGARWEDLEGRVTPGTWKVIMSHPIARKRELTNLLPYQGMEEEVRRAM